MLRLRFERLKRCMTQTDLADLAGVRQCDISDWEIGNTTPNEDQLEMLAFALKISPARVLLQPTVVLHDADVVRWER
jgi:transcriptional regulator with XRE-family HTH domain